MKQAHHQLLEQIRTELHSTPELAAYITEAMVRGLQESATLQRHRAADMETVAMMALNTRLFKGNESHIAKLLRKWQSQASIRLDDVISKLEAKT